MNPETMEYALNQTVIYDHPGGTITGTIIGDSGNGFIIALDCPLDDGTRAIVASAGDVRPLGCRWCQDVRKVPVASFTMGQADAGEIPEIDCPYCSKT